MAEEPNKFSGKGCLVIVTFILFMINTIKFINDPASEVPVLSILFNMILYLGIIIFILHKKEVSLDKYILSQIDKYNNKKLYFKNNTKLKEINTL